MRLPNSAIQTAREAAGLDVETAAQRVRVGVTYLRSVESGRRVAPYVLAKRLSRLYSCPLDAFLNTTKGDDGRTN